MQNIDNMGQNSLNSLSRNNLTSKGKKKLTVDIVGGLISVVCLTAGLIYTYILNGQYAVVPQLLYFIAFLIEGIPIIVTGVKGIFGKDITNAMEILVAIAIIACAFNKQLILAVLIPLILNCVHILEERSIMGGRDVIESLKNMQQNTAVLYENGEEIPVEAKKLKIGQTVIIKPGAGIPVDGTVISGESHVDEKSLTGEPEPVHVKPDGSVYAGTVNIEGTLVVKIEKEYVDTSFSKILKLLEKSENMSVPEAKIVDRFLVYYIPFVLAIAAFVALITHDITRAIAVLVVSCPCGQMLASPAPMIAALSVTSKRGILIKNSKFLENLSDISTVVFDKTGTITKGELYPVDIVAADGVETAELLLYAKAVAMGSNHPVAKATAEYCRELECPKNFTVKEIMGAGMEGINQDGSQTVRFGKKEWIEQNGCKIPDEFVRENTIGSISFVSVNNQLLGYICYNDTVRDKAQECISSLKEMNIKETVMLTGDREDSANLIAHNVGIDKVYAKLLPQDKLDRLKQFKTGEEKVLAIGDGINDALILKNADVGIVMGAMGSDLAIDSADIALMNNNLENIPYIINLSKKTKKIIYQNIMLALSTSVLMILLSALGIVTAIMGSVFHNIGAFVVLINSARILKEENDAGDNA